MAILKSFFGPAHLDDKIPGAPDNRCITKPESSEMTTKFVFSEKYFVLFREKL